MTFAVDIPCVLSVFIYDLPTEDMKEMDNLFFFTLRYGRCLNFWIHMSLIGCIIRIFGVTELWKIYIYNIKMGEMDTYKLTDTALSILRSSCMSSAISL